MTDPNARRAVSAVVPVHNGAPFIADALDSIFAQTVPPDEVIVVDDGSTDGSDRIIAAHPRSGDVRVVRQEKSGVSVARNVGVASASHPWIAFLDGDDVWLPRRLELQHAVLDRNPEVHWVAGALREVPLQGRPVTHALVRGGHARLGPTQAFPNLFEVLERCLRLSTITLLIHRRCFEETGGFDPALRRREDLDLWIRIAFLHPSLGWVDEPIAEYRRQASSVTNTLTPISALDILRMLRRRVEEHPGAGPLCLPYARHMAAMSTKIWLHRESRADLAHALSEFPEWLPERWRGGLRLVASSPLIYSAVRTALNARLRALGRGPGATRRRADLRGIE